MTWVGFSAGQLRLVHSPGAPYGLLQGGPDGWVEPGQRLVQGLGRHPGGGQVDAVEPGGVLADGFGAAAPDLVAQRPDLRDGRLDIGRGARQDAGQGGPAEAAGGVPAQVDTAQVDTGNHPPSLRRVAPGRRPPYSASSRTTEVIPGQSASALLAPRASDERKKAPSGLTASRWL